MLAAIAIQHFLLDRILGNLWSDAATAALLILGVAGFSWQVWRLLERTEVRLRAAHLRERAQRRHLQALAAATLDAVTESDLDVVAQRIVERSRAVTGARYGALAVVGSDGGIVSFYTSGLDAEVRARLGPPPEGHGLLGLVATEGETLRLADLRTHPRSVGFPPNHPPMRSLLAVPVRLRGALIGSLYLCDREDGRPFSLSDQEALQHFAAQAAAAIQIARLYKHMQELSIITERERIAMDLHDGVIQSLFGVRLQLEAAAAALPAGDPTAESLDAAADRLGAVMSDVRHYVFDLRTALDDEGDLGDRLQALIAQVAPGDMVDATLRCEGQPRPVGRTVIWEMWHIAHEALANALRHSGGSRIELSLAYAPEWLTMEIADNGRGWDGRAAGPQHHGIDNMRRRAQAIGAALDVQGGAGEGTRVRVSVPGKHAFGLAGTAGES